MTLNLGTISASVTLDLGGLTRGASQAQSIFDRLGAGGSKGLDAVEQAANRAGSALKSLGAAKVTVDTGGAVGELRNVESAVQSAASSINGLGNESITIDTGGAVSELQGIQTAVQGTESSLSTLSNTHISVDTAGAVGELHSVETAVQGVEATIGTVSGTPLTISTGSAVGDLQSIETAVQGVEASVGTVSGTPLTISTTGTVGDLQSVETAVTGVASSIGAVSGTPLTIDTSGAVGSLNAVDQALDLLGGKLAAAGAGVTTFFGFSLGKSAGLESALANVNSIANVSKSELDGLKGTILDLSVQLGASPTGLADGLYDVVSSGFKANDAIEILTKSAIAAKAGLTDTSVAVRAITAVLNAYGLKASEAGNVSDVLFQIVNSGVITFEQLANNMGSVLPVASVLKVSIQELGAAYAQLTLKGVNASAAETGIAALMRSAIQPTTAMKDALKEYGFASGEALIKSQGLAGYLVFLGEASGGTAAGMSKLLGNVEATNAALSLSANGGAGYTAMLKDMDSAAQNGATTLGVFAIQSDTTNQALDRLQATFGKFQITMGDAISGPVTAAAGILTAFLGTINMLPGPLQAVIGNFTAFIGVSIAVKSAIGLMQGAMALMGTSFGQLSGVSALSTALRSVIGMLGLTRAATTAVSLAMGPLGIVLAAVGGAFLLMHHSMQMDKEAADALRASMQELADAIEMVRRRGDTALADMAQGLGKALSDLPKQVQQIQQQILQTMGDPTIWRNNRFNELVAQGMAPGKAVDQAMKDWQALIPGIRVSGDEIIDVNKKIVEALNDPNINASVFISWAQGLISAAEAIKDPTERAKALSAAIKTIDSTPLSTFSTTATAAGASTEKASTGIKAFFDVIKSGMDSLAASTAKNSGSNNSFLKSLGLDDLQVNKVESQWNKLKGVWKEGIENGPGANGSAKEWRDWINAVPQGGDEWQRRADLAGKNAKAQADINQQEREATASTLVDVLKATTEQIDAQNKAFGEMIQNGLAWQGVEANLGNFNMSGMGTQYSVLAQNVTQAGTALDTVTRVVIGNTDAIASNAQGLADWSNKLIGARGEYAAVDDLLSKGMITLEEYNAAQEAQVVLTQNAAGVALDMQAIQAKQAPLLAQLSDQQHVYIDQLREMPAAQQLIALGWMDANEAAKANQIITTAAAAANGELGEAGKAATEQMIIGAAQADPVLKAMLQDMKLISVGADGTITVNFDQAKGANDAMNELTKSIDGLITQLGGIPPVHLDVDAGDATGAVEDYITSLDSVKTMGDMISSTPIEAQINLDENGVDQTISDVSGALTQLDGKTATATVAVSFQGNAISGDGTAGDVAGIAALAGAQPIEVPATAKVDTVDTSTLPADTSISITAKVATVDTSAIDGIKDKAITVTADVSQAVIGVYNLTTQIDNIADKSTTLTVDTKLNDTTGLLAGFSTAGGGAGTLEDKSITIDVKTDVDTTEIDALNDKTITITADVQLNDPTGLLGSGSGVVGLPDTSMTRTLTVDVVAHDPEGYLGSQTGGITRTLTVNVVAHDPQSLISHSYDSGGGGVLAGLSRTLTVNVELNDPTGLLGSATGVVGLPDTSTMTRTITVNAVDNTATILAAVAAAVTAIPTAHTTSISESGSAVVVGMATSAKTAVEAIPTAWATSITESGGAIVTGSANDANAAISDIPTSWSTQFSESGSGNVIGAANGIANAVNNVPSGKTISFNIVTTGSIPRFATGGIIPAETTVARLAERGPELFRNPSGSYGMATTDSLYPMTPGARVFTAAQTKRMLSTWDGPAYARGGVVGGSNVNTDLLDIARNLAAYGGDYTPKPIVDVLLKIQELGKVGGATTQQLKMFSDQLKAFNGDNTPWAIVEQALRLDKIASSLQPSTQGLTGVYGDAARYFGYAMGTMGGAILNGWEELTNGFWKSVASGTIQKGTLAEDGSYVNPGFYQAGSTSRPSGGADTSWLHSTNGPIVTTGNQDAITKYFQSMYDEMDMDAGNDFLTHVSDWAGPRHGGEIYTTMRAVGEDMANGVYEGIQNYSGLASQATLDMVLAAKRAAEESMGIQSPSKVFAGIGAYMGQGLAIGIASAVPTVQKATRGLTAAAAGSGSGGRGARPSFPTRASQQSSNTTVVDNSTTTVPVNVYPQSTLTAEESRTLYTNVARAITGSTDTVRTSKGVRG